jgi:hypothetical protein
MSTTSPVPNEPGPAEQPTMAARVKIETERTAWVKLTARDWITGEGTVPLRDVRYLIKMFGVVSCVVSGIGGAALTMSSDAPLRAPVAFAELLLALIGAVLIVGGGRFQRGAPVEDRVPADIAKPALPNGNAG